MLVAVKLVSGSLSECFTLLQLEEFSFLISAALVLLRVATKADFREVKVAFFNSPNSSKFLVFPLDDVIEIMNHEDFDADRKTVLYIHGYRQSLASPSLILVVDAFLKRQTHNILVLDWSAYAYGNYITNAVPNLIQVKLQWRELAQLTLEYFLRSGEF